MIQKKDSLGEYIPGFFRIYVKKKLHEGVKWSDFSKEEMATIIHEYIHFLQDISTTRGINYFSHVSKILQMDFAKAYQCENVIMLPFNFEEMGENTAYAEMQLQIFYWGYEKNIKIHHINKIVSARDELIESFLTDGEEMREIKIYYDDKDIPYIFGACCVAESMAYLIETELFGGLQRNNEFPYNSCEMVCQRLSPKVLDNKAILVAACELSLMHYHAGEMFWYIISEIEKENLNFKSVSDFEAYFMPRTQYLSENMYKEFSGIQERLDFLYPIDIPGNKKVKEEVRMFFNKGITYRKNNGLFISKLFEADNPLYNISEWMEYFGIPLVCDSDNNVFAGSDLSNIMMPIALYNFFERKSGNACELIPFCGEQKNINFNPVICDETPWQQADYRCLCPFGAYWHHYSLGGKSVERNNF